MAAGVHIVPIPKLSHYISRKVLPTRFDLGKEYCLSEQACLDGFFHGSTWAEHEQKSLALIPDWDVPHIA
eukprot:1161163-Pelagomonas_calceolata.AAC.1